MLYRIEGGDALKILPFIENNKLVWGKQYDIVGLPNRAGLIYDTNGYLSKMRKIHRDGNCSNRYDRSTYEEGYKPVNITRKTMFHVYINGESKLVGLGRKMVDLMAKNKATLFDLRCNDHILVDKEMVTVNHSGMILPSYDKSSVISRDWTAPVTDINSKEEWFEYLRNNQPNTDPYGSKYNIFNNREALIELFGGDLLSEVIINERNEKLDEILN